MGLFSLAHIRARVDERAHKHIHLMFPLVSSPFAILPRGICSHLVGGTPSEAPAGIDSLVDPILCIDLW